MSHPDKPYRSEEISPPRAPKSPKHPSNPPLADNQPDQCGRVELLLASKGICQSLCWELERFEHSATWVIVAWSQNVAHIFPPTSFCNTSLGIINLILNCEVFLGNKENNIIYFYLPCQCTHCYSCQYPRKPPRGLQTPKDPP